MNLSKSQKIIGINLSLFLFIVGFFGLQGGDAFILAALVLVGQVIINAIASIVSFITKDTSAGMAYLLSAGIILLIGFSFCSSIMRL